ncbi:hypothetical protein RJ639_034037, partial [Escallonia herrerae]
ERHTNMAEHSCQVIISVMKKLLRDEQEQDSIETRLEKKASRLLPPPNQDPIFVHDPVGRIERGFIHFKATEFEWKSPWSLGIVNVVVFRHS